MVVERSPKTGFHGPLAPLRSAAGLRVPTPSSGVPRAVIADPGHVLDARLAVGAAPSLPPGSPTPEVYHVPIASLPISKRSVIGFFLNEGEILQQLVKKGNTTLESIWHGVAHAAGIVKNEGEILNKFNLLDLGFRVEIHRPMNDKSRRWARNDFIKQGDSVITEFHDIRVPNDRDSIVDRIILQGEPNGLYGIDPTGNVEKLASHEDMAGYGRQGRPCYIKVGFDDAVIQIEQIMPQERRAEATDQQEPQHEELETLRLLKRYFTQDVPRAIEVIRGRETAKSSEPAPASFTPREGVKKFARPIMGEANAPAIGLAAKDTRTVSKHRHGFFNYVLPKWFVWRWQAAGNLLKAIPLNRHFFGFFMEKGRLMREAGWKKVVGEFFATAWRLYVLSKVHRFICLLPRVRGPVTGRFAFLVHPRDIEDLYRWFPFFRYLPRAWVMERVKFLPPVVASKMSGLTLVKRGTPIEGFLLSMLLTPQHMEENPQMARFRAVQEVRLAVKKRVSFIGLGALLPSLTRYGSVPRKLGSAIGITTGHAYTSLMIARMALKIKETIPGSKDELIAVVGAAGSTGTASAKVLAQNGVHNLLLIDRELKREGLARLRKEIMAIDPTAAWNIQLSTDNSDISRSRIIVTVTNSPKAIITEDMLRPGMIFIDDAQPPNISKEIAEKRSDIRVLKVLAQVPNLNTHFDFGLGTSPDITFTCLAEAAAFAQHGWTDDNTVGYVTQEDVSRVEDLAHDAKITLPDSFFGYSGVEYSVADIRAVASLWNRG